MTDLETRILGALRELEERAHAVATTNSKPDLLAVFAELDTLTAQLPAISDPELRHFLQRKSYDKAKRLLEGRGDENAPGRCR